MQRVSLGPLSHFWSQCFKRDGETEGLPLSRPIQRE